MGLTLDIVSDGDLLLTSRDHVGAQETLAVMRRVRALVDERPRRIVVDLRLVVDFDPTADAFTRGMLHGTVGRIHEIVIVGGHHHVMRAAGATAAFLGAPFVFREAPPSWAAPPPAPSATV